MGKVRMNTTVNRCLYNRSLFNKTLDNGTSYYDHDLDEYVTFLVKISNILHSIIFVLGIIGNGLVIWIAGFRMKKTVSAVWFLNLAIADIYCCASLPLRIVQWYNYFHGTLNITCLVCKLSIGLFTENMCASIFLLTAMSIDRCVSVLWPFWAKVHRTRKLVWIIAGGIWVLSIVFSLVVYCLYEFYNVDVNEWCVVDFYDANPNLRHNFQLARFVIMFGIPLLIFLISYVIIILKIRKSNRPQRSQRPYWIIFAIILCFFICWSPYYIFSITSIYDRTDIEFHVINTTFIILAVFNSCLNPIIYVFMGQDFRQGFFRSIPARVEKALSEHPYDAFREPEDGGPARTRDV
ncbi:N-formyl peptide receptor 3-like [Leptodactylus fuscus]|uniref:N-formyl peptide receptor 3-like n=1 Tax=Leptodactylus fuscus TaxID=238119 RepID=UPI003F4F3B8F